MNILTYITDSEFALEGLTNLAMYQHLAIGHPTYKGEMLLYYFDLIFSVEPDDYLKSRLRFRFSAPAHAQSEMCKNDIPIVDDAAAEPCEDFIVKISSPSKRAVIDGDSATVVIHDDEGILVISILFYL